MMKCVMSQSAPVISLVTMKKRNSPWWRLTTTSFVEGPDCQSISKTITHRQAGWPWFSTTASHRTVAKSCYNSYFLPVLSVCQTDKQQQRACDLLLCRPWLAFAMSTPNCWQRRLTHFNQLYKHPKLRLILKGFPFYYFIRKYVSPFLSYLSCILHSLLITISYSASWEWMSSLCWDFKHYSAAGSLLHSSLHVYVLRGSSLTVYQSLFFLKDLFFFNHLHWTLCPTPTLH